MSYKLYVTYICCIILNSIQIHYNPSRTYIYIHQSIVFGQLLLRIHYLMAQPGLDTVEGSQTFTSFLVRLLVDLGLLQARGRRCALFEMYACVNVCVCVYSPACIGCLPLFSSWVKHFLRISSHSLFSADCLNLTQGSPVTSGELIHLFVSAHSKYLCFHLCLIPHFEAGVSVTADFPVNWSQCQRPWKQPIFEGAVLESLSLLRRLPLESRLRWGHHLFQFLRTERVEQWALSTTVFRNSRTEGESFLWLEVILDDFVGKVKKDRLVLPQASLRCQIKFCIQRTIINVTNIQFFYFRSLPQSDLWWCYRGM